MLTGRRVCREMMDDPEADRGDLDRSLRFIRRVNRRMGGISATLGHLRRWSADWPAGEVVRVVDLGTGSADIPLAIVRWARGRGLRVHVTGVDAHPTTLELAREQVGDEADVELVCADALALTERYEPGSFDYAHAGMFLHHLDDIEVMTALRIMERLARRGLIWNDLVRGPVEAAAIRLLTLGHSAMVRHDAVASVAAGFTRSEVLELAGRVGLANAEYRRYLWGRFTLVSTRP